MKQANEISKEALIEAIQDINKQDAFQEPIPIVGVTMEFMLKEFKEAIETLQANDMLEPLTDDTINLYNNNDMNEGPYPWEAPQKKLLNRSTQPPVEAPVQQTQEPAPQTQEPETSEPKKRGRKLGWKKNKQEEQTPASQTQETQNEQPAKEPEKKTLDKQEPEKKEEKLPMDRGGLYKKDLYPILLSLRAGLSAKSTLEEMASFMFTGKDVVTYNDSILVVAPFVTDFTATIKATDLLNVLKPLPNDEFLKFTLEDTVLELQTQGAKFRFAIVTSDSGKILGASGVKDVVNGVRSELAQGTWKDIPENFKDAAKLCAFSAAKKETLGTLTCIAIHDRAVISCDNRRMSRYALSDIMPNFLISASVIPTLINYDIEKYCLTDSWVGFTTKDNLMVGVRRKNGNYPVNEITDVLLQSGDFTIDADTALLKQAIEEVGVFAPAEEMNEMIDVTIKGDMMYLKSKSERGSAECSIEIATDLEGEDEKSFSINPTFWLDVLQKAPVMKLDTKNFKARFEAGKFCHVVALGAKN